MAIWRFTETDSRVKPRKSVQAVQVASEGEPAITDGLNLQGVAGFNLFAVCDVGEAFTSDTTTFKAYRFDATAGVMTRASEHDVSVGVGGVGARGICATFTVASPRGRIIHIWDGTGVTGGNVTVTYTASMLVGDLA
jgi:hypothetical protein